MSNWKKNKIDYQNENLRFCMGLIVLYYKILSTWGSEWEKFMLSELFQNNFKIVIWGFLFSVGHCKKVRRLKINVFSLLSSSVDYK